MSNMICLKSLHYRLPSLAYESIRRCVKSKFTWAVPVFVNVFWLFSKIFGLETEILHALSSVIFLGHHSASFRTARDTYTGKGCFGRRRTCSLPFWMYFSGHCCTIGCNMIIVNITLYITSLCSSDIGSKWAFLRKAAGEIPVFCLNWRLKK